MAGEALQIDPLSEDAANVPLTLVDNTTSFLLEHDYPPPDRDFQYASSTDTEGELPVAAHYKNRQITVKLRIVGANDAARDLAVGYLQQKVAKLDRECGTLKRTTAAGLSIVFDVVGAKIEVASDKKFVTGSRAMVSLVFEARPFGRGTAATTSTSSETTLPALVFTVPSIPGDVPALGKLVINELQAVDQWWVLWGMQSRYYNSSADAALFYQAEGRTALGTAAAGVGAAGASGTGSNVVFSGALTPNYVAMLSTQATGGGAHMSHVGDFSVWARVYVLSSNVGTTSVRLEWGEGDFRRRTVNEAVTIAGTGDPRKGGYALVDLGQVHLTKVAQGTQRWEGRILAKGETTGNIVGVDCLLLVPVSEGSGQVSALQQYETPSVFSARDEFDQVAGALTGKTLPVGGTWAGAGSGTGDFAVETTGKTAQRTAVDTTPDTGGRFAIAGTGTLGNAIVQTDLKSTFFPGAGAPISGNNVMVGPVARYTDTSNYVMAIVWSEGGLAHDEIRFVKRLAGVTTILGRLNVGELAESAYYTMRLMAIGGRWFVWVFAQGASSGSPVLQGYDSDLASGTLSSGKVGLYDGFGHSVAETATRNYDNFFAAVPIADAAVFASQSLEIRNDRVIREDSTGTYWTSPSKYEGDYLLVPPAGREARTARFIVKASRNDPETMADSSIDDISAALTYTPRYLVVPE